MFKLTLLSLLAACCLGQNATCGYEPRMIFYAESNPKLYQVPARPNMSAEFEYPEGKRLKRTIRDLHARLLTAQEQFDPALPQFVVDEKVNVILRLLFQDGMDILNFLYNSPDEPCVPATEATPTRGQSVVISDSFVTVNYMNLAKGPEQIVEPDGLLGYSTSDEFSHDNHYFPRHEDSSENSHDNYFPYEYDGENEDSNENSHDNYSPYDYDGDYEDYNYWD